MALVLSEPRFEDTYPTNPAPLDAAHAVSELVTTPAELAAVNDRTRRTLQRVEAAQWVIAATAIAVMATVLIVHWIAQ